MAESYIGQINQHIVGNSTIAQTEAGMRLTNHPTSIMAYNNAQLDDYQGIPCRAFRWRPPLTLTLEARFSHPAGTLSGTAGFGFWNDPFMMTGSRSPSLPRAIWFFYSSAESNMALAIDQPGHGWKAATIDAWRWPFFLLAPTAPVAMPLMRIRSLYRALWPLAQRAIGVSEQLVEVDLTTWHSYRIEWGVTSAHFFVDDRLVLACDTSPRGPLGLVIWKDNQAMVVTPWGSFHHTLVAAATNQWLEVATVAISTT